MVVGVFCIRITVGKNRIKYTIAGSLWYSSTEIFLKKKFVQSIFNINLREHAQIL
jgi:hypothetical protein